MEPAPGFVVQTSRRYTLSAGIGGTWAAVERIRLANGEAADAVAEVEAFLTETATHVASWWICERSTPAGLEAQLLEAGCELIPSDYEIDGLVTTTAPPPVDGIEARAVADAGEYVQLCRLQEEIFADPRRVPRTDDELVADYEGSRRVAYAAWLDGRMAAAAFAAFTGPGALLSGGATAEWARGRGAYRALVRARWDDAVARGTPTLVVAARPSSSPILRRLGFGQVVRFRRLESRL